MRAHRAVLATVVLGLTGALTLATAATAAGSGRGGSLPAQLAARYPRAYAPGHTSHAMSGTKEPNARLAARASSTAVTADDPVVLAGDLLGTSGAPEAATSVRVDLEPSERLAATTEAGVGLALIKLDEETTDTTGHFVLHANPLGDLTGYLNPDGTVSLLVTSSGADGQLLYHLRAYPPTADQPTWRWADVDDEVTSGATIPPTTAAGTLSTGATSLSGPATSGTAAGGGTLTGLTLRAQTAAGASSAVTLARRAGVTTAAATPLASGNPADYCVGTSYYWTRSDANIIKNYDRVQRIFTLNRSHWDYDWSTTNNTSVDAAGSYKNGALFTAGYTSVQNDSAGVNFSAGNNSNWDASVQFDNRAWYLYCRDSSYGGKTWYSGYYEWRPYKFTGDNRNLDPKYAIFSCNAQWKIGIQNNLWVARTTTHTYQAGASIAGLGVRVKQENSQYHRLVFKPDSGSTAYLCGSDDYPVGARQVREVSP